MSNPKMTWPEIKVWRRATRNRMLAARAALSAPVREALSQRLATRLKARLQDMPQPISLYWPIKAEPNLRPLMKELDAAGIAVCLPIAIKLGEPLRFRPWHKGCAMERGFWDIPVPATKEEVEPRTLIAPIVGYDGARYRLGYGGGFFDRTLEKYGGAAQAIGIGYGMFRLPTIHPQPHDIRMATIVTEAETFSEESAQPSSAVCYLNEADTAYAGFAGAREISAPLAALRGALPPERMALVDYALWQLGITDLETPPEDIPAENTPAGEVVAQLDSLLPRIRDNGLHATVTALRDSLTAG